MFVVTSSREVKAIYYGAVVLDGGMIGPVWRSDVNLGFFDFELRQDEAMRSYMHVRTL